MTKQRRTSRREFLKQSARAGEGLAALYGLSWPGDSTATTSESDPGTILPGALRCEYRENPLGIDALQPRLSWILMSLVPGARGQRQTAYQILAASSQERLQSDQGDLWDTGKVESDRSTQLAYAGKPLGSRQSAWWKVRVWDESGKVSPWSRPAQWSMGLLDKADWKGNWIGLDGGEGKPQAYGIARLGKMGWAEHRELPARMLRKDFQVTGKVRRAMLYVSGLGLFEAYLNGQKVSPDVLVPALTDYDKRVFYLTYEVTNELSQGANALGVMLGNGRYFAPRLTAPTATRTFGYPKLLLQLEVEYRNGRKERVVSDESWKLTTEGPIRSNNVYDGEIYDATREMNGWSGPGFADSSWQQAKRVEAPSGMLAAQMISPIQVRQTLKPVKITEPKPGYYIFDMGQNMVGWCRLMVSGPKGTRISLRHAETLRPDGTLYLDNLRSAWAEDVYTLRGQGTEVYEPRFTYHGFRYVEVNGFPGTPELSNLEGCVVHDALPEHAQFATSDPLINRIYKNVFWGTRGNYRSIPTDCPQRDERQGWLGDRSAESRGETFLFDVAAFYAKWMDDIEDSQLPSGSVSDVSPAYWPFYNDNVTWPASFFIVSAHLYDQYGDLRVIGRHYGGMKRWITHMHTYLKDDLMPRDTYGDWCVPPRSLTEIHSKDPARQTDSTLLGTAYFYHLLRIMERNATLLKKTDDANDFKSLAVRLRNAFNQKFLNSATGEYGNGSQTSNILPLAFGMVPESERNKTLDALVRSITVQSHGHIGSGLIGCQWLMQLLSGSGQADLAYEIAKQKTYPSWGYMVSRGATTVWELWNGDTANPAMNSRNHLMLVGDLLTWFYENLAGIRSDPANPGFQSIVMHPTPVRGLTFVKASHQSPYGEIVSDWKREDETFLWNVTIPVNTVATLFVPVSSAAHVSESGQPSKRSPGVTWLRDQDGTAQFRVGSGTYRFVSHPRSRQSLRSA
jgi:alpha-L-rhamnosidase